MLWSNIVKNRKASGFWFTIDTGNHAWFINIGGNVNARRGSFSVLLAVWAQASAPKFWGGQCIKEGRGALVWARSLARRLVGELPKYQQDHRTEQPCTAKHFIFPILLFLESFFLQFSISFLFCVSIWN